MSWGTPADGRGRGVRLGRVIVVWELRAIDVAGLRTVPMLLA
jgi:hypothetical protein